MRAGLAHPSKAMDVGMAGEHLVCADLILSGYRAYLAPHGFGYDVLMDLGDRLLRVQVKSSLAPRNVVSSKRLARMAYSFAVSRRGLGKLKRLCADDCDLIALAALDCRTVAYFPIQDASQTIQLSLPGDRSHGGSGKGRIGPIDGFPIEAAIANDRTVFDARKLFCRRGHPKPRSASCAECRRQKERARSPRRNRIRRIAATAATVIGLCFPSLARPHDDAQWIQAGEYAGAGGVHCCGVRDCQRVYPAAVRWFPDSVLVVIPIDGALAEIQVAMVGVHPSKDVDFWMCSSAETLRNGSARCFFIPQMSNASGRWAK